MTPRRQDHAKHHKKTRLTCATLAKCGLRALAIAQLLTTSLHAGHVHEPQEPLNLLPALRHVMSGAASKAPAAERVSSSRRDSGRDRDAGRRDEELANSGPASSKTKPDSTRTAVAWRDGARLQVLSGMNGASAGSSPDNASRYAQDGEVLIDFSGALGGEPTEGLPPRESSASMRHRLTPEGARRVIRTFGLPSEGGRALAGSSKDTARKLRARGGLSLAAPGRDPAVQRDGTDPEPTVEDLEGASQMEMHWSADAVGLSTFVGGSQAAEAAHATAFGRDIGAEVGLQFLDSDARAYRVMVARSFKNDLDAPVQEAKFQFEMNVHF